MKTSVSESRQSKIRSLSISKTRHQAKSFRKNGVHAAPTARVASRARCERGHEGSAKTGYLAPPIAPTFHGNRSRRTGVPSHAWHLTEVPFPVEVRSRRSCPGKVLKAFGKLNAKLIARGMPLLQLNRLRMRPKRRCGPDRCDISVHFLGAIGL